MKRSRYLNGHCSHRPTNCMKLIRYAWQGLRNLYKGAYLFVRAGGGGGVENEFEAQTSPFDALVGDAQRYFDRCR